MLTAYLGIFGSLTLIAVFYITGKWKLYKNLPPGPTRIEFVILQLKAWIHGRAPYKMYQDMAKTYGPVVYAKAGALQMVLLQDMHHIREALMHEDWVDRYFNEWMAQRSFGKNLGVFVSTGDVWKEMRRYSIRTLRDYGPGKQQNLERVIQDELEALTNRLFNKIEIGKNIVSMKHVFMIPVLNTLATMSVGTAYDHKDPKVKHILDLMDVQFKKLAIGMPNALTFHSVFPRLAKIASLFSETVRGSGYKEGHEKGHQFFREILEERRAIGDYKEDPRYGVDAFLREIDKNMNENSGKGHYTDEQFLLLSIDFAFAGAETTNNLLEFAILYMILHPEIQRKVQAEIDDVIGSCRFSSNSDKPNMPYTNATILEVLRLGNVLPILVRSPVPGKETKIGKYTIPEGAIGFINFYAINMDNLTWRNPKEFNPERFLDSENNIINADKLLPFGTGKRACFGEFIATTSLFIFFTTMLQKFNFEASPEHPPPTAKPVLGFTLSATPYHVLIKDRLAQPA